MSEFSSYLAGQLKIQGISGKDMAARMGVAPSLISGLGAAQNSSRMIVITEREARTPAISGTLPKKVQDVLKTQPGGAFVSFYGL